MANLVTNSEIFTKRIGTTNYGLRYEVVNIANLTLKLTTDETVPWFKVSSNNEDQYGNFDDVILEMRRDNTETVIAIQLKHSNERKNLELKSVGKNGCFSVKYLESYKKIIKNRIDCITILYTTRMLTLEPGEATFKLEKEDFFIKIFECEPISFLNSPHGKCYRFEIVRSDEDESPKTEDELSIKEKEYQEFFKKFFLYANQANVIKTEQQACEEFQRKFSCTDTEFSKYLEFISKWSEEEGPKKKLFKSWIKSIIAINLLSPSIKYLVFGPVTEKMKRIQETANEFHVTVLEEKSYDNVKTIWGESREALKDVDAVNEIIKHYNLLSYDKSVDKLSPKDCSKILWLMGKVPLIVTECETVYRGIELIEKEKKIVLLLSELKHSKLSALSDLNVASDLYTKIVSEFKVSLQGKTEVTLKDLIKQNLEFCKISDLLEMLNSSYCIGGEEVLQVPYISRRLSRIVIDFNFLKDIDHNSMVVISCVSKVRNKLSGCDLIDICTEEQNRGGKIYFTECSFSKEEFNRFCLKNNGLKIYHFDANNEDLELVHSNGDINSLREYQLNDSFINEQDLFHTFHRNNINLVSGEPGIGKTEFMKSIKNNVCPTFWTVILYPKDVSSFCSGPSNQTVDEFKKFLFDTKYSALNTLDKRILKELMQKDQIVYVFDGVDELSNEEIDQISNIISQIAKENVTLWITCRKHVKSKLETKFYTLARFIKPFSEEQQEEYLRQRLQEICDEEELQKITQSIFKSLKTYTDLLGYPVQAFMLTDLLRTQKKKYLPLLKEEVFNVADLYYYFVDEQFNIYYFSKENQSSESILLTFKNSVLNEYEKAALKALDPQVFEELVTENDEFLEGIQGDSDRIGFIAKVDANLVPHFSHTSLGEYLVANFFSRHQKSRKCKLYFKENMFCPKFSNVRFFFDLILAKSSKLHAAVVYKNIDVLKKNEASIKDAVDLGGRNLLHVACSWGRTYPYSKLEEVNETYYVLNIDKNLAYGYRNANLEEDSGYIEMLNYLLDKCDSTKKDGLFEFTPLLYAEKAACLYSKSILLHKQNKKFEHLSADETMGTFLLCSAVFGYNFVLDLYQNLPMIRVKYSHKSLLQFSIMNNQKSYLKKLLSHDAYMRRINDPCDFSYTPLVEACQEGNKQIVQLLLDSGASTEGCATDTTSSFFDDFYALKYSETGDEFWKSTPTDRPEMSLHIHSKPLVMACYQGHIRIVEILLARGANVNTTEVHNDNQTSLHRICSQVPNSSYERIVQLLIEARANINARDDTQKTPLHLACEFSSTKIVRLLIDASADINATTESNRTPLDYACKNLRYDTTVMLIEAGADIDTVNPELIMPFMCAVAAKVVNIDCLSSSRRTALNQRMQNLCSPFYQFVTTYIMNNQVNQTKP